MHQVGTKQKEKYQRHLTSGDGAANTLSFLKVSASLGEQKILLKVGN